MPDRIHPHHPKHDPRNCRLCSTLRHHTQAKAGRALTRHLAKHPFPKQETSA